MMTKNHSRAYIHTAYIHTYVCQHTSATARFRTFGAQGCSSSERGRKDLKDCIYCNIYAHTGRRVYSRHTLARNIKRDCMADLCKYLRPANKRVLERERERGRRKDRNLFGRELGKMVEEGSGDGWVR